MRLFEFLQMVSLVYKKQMFNPLIPLKMEATTSSRVNINFDKAVVLVFNNSADDATTKMVKTTLLKKIEEETDPETKEMLSSILTSLGLD